MKRTVRVLLGVLALAGCDAPRPEAASALAPEEPAQTQATPPTQPPAQPIPEVPVAVTPVKAGVKIVAPDMVQKPGVKIVAPDMVQKPGSAAKPKSL